LKLDDRKGLIFMSVVQLQHLVPGEIEHAPPTTSITRTSVFGEIKSCEKLYLIQHTGIW